MAMLKFTRHIHQRGHSY